MNPNGGNRSIEETLRKLNDNGVGLKWSFQQHTLYYYALVPHEEAPSLTAALKKEDINLYTDLCTFAPYCVSENPYREMIYLVIPTDKKLFEDRQIELRRHMYKLRSLELDLLERYLLGL